MAKAKKTARQQFVDERKAAPKAKAKAKAAPTPSPAKVTPPPKPAEPDTAAQVKKAGKARGLGLKIDPVTLGHALRIVKAYVDERIAVCGKQVLGNTATAVALWNALVLFTDELSDAIKSPAEKAINLLRFTIVPELMGDDDITAVTFEGIGRINVMDDIQLSVLDKEQLAKWLKKEDMEDLIKETVNSQTLAAALRARIKDGKPMPPEDAVTVKGITRAQITRG